MGLKREKSESGSSDGVAALLHEVLKGLSSSLFGVLECGP